MQMEGGGVLEYRQEGGRVKFSAERERDEAGLYKVWLRGRGDLLLGTLIPEGEKLRLDRVLTVKELERNGCWPPERAEVRLVFPFGRGKNDGWTVISALPELIQDPLLRRSLRGRLWSRRGENGGCLVAAVFQTDRPVPLEPVFCLGRVEELEGRACLVWEFDGGGRPILPASKPAKNAGQM